MEMTVPQIPVLVRLVDYNLDSGLTTRIIFSGPMVAVPRAGDDIVIDGVSYTVSRVTFNPSGAVLIVTKEWTKEDE